MTTATDNHDQGRPNAADDGSSIDPNVGEAAERLARRPWPATPLRGLEISFEFFPTATPEGAARLERCAAELASLRPTFASVTYGAGGSTQERTFRSLEAVLDGGSVPAAAHLTCVGKSKAQVNDIVDQYVDMGVDHIVALRGDPPEG